MVLGAFLILLSLQSVFTQSTGNNDCNDAAKFAGSCRGWREAGYCNEGQQYLAFMKRSCKRTCEFCKGPIKATPPPCKDDVKYATNCPRYNKLYCEAEHQHYGFMKKNCKKTCGFCVKKSRVIGGAKVHGGFTAWSGFNSCSKLCGGGTQKRSRSCTNPSPKNGGRNCNGAKEESRSCNKGGCKVDGKFTAWGDFSSCSKSCGGGTQKRSRSCTNPRPKNGGKNCDGAKEESRNCNTGGCKDIFTSTKCEDKLTAAKCQSYKSYCEVCAYRGYMKANCQKTCDLCAPPECGKGPAKKGRVVGGVPADKPWPWQAGMVVNGKFHCGGSLIDRQWIVTAAHCINTEDLSKIKITLGDMDRSKDEGTEQTIGVVKIVSHKQYNPLTHGHDIALLKLEKKATLNDRVGLICLPPKGAPTPVKENCYITGWGRTKTFGNHSITLQEASLKAVTNAQCIRLNRNRVTDHMVCAGYGYDFDRSESGCQGDSGGPFVCATLTNKRWELHGAVSWGSSRCVSTERYTVFTRVSMYRDWMKQQMDAC